jgi:hypothetical protein
VSVIRHNRGNKTKQAYSLISASQLYSYLICPHRVTMDAFGDPAKREEPNAFVKLLWERGTLSSVRPSRG